MTARFDPAPHRASFRDPPLDYCLWPYEPPAAPDAGALRSSALLYQSFEVAGLSPRMAAFCDALREAVGPFKTVWGIKHAGGTLSWEFYIYDYARLGRAFGIADFARACAPFFPLIAPAADDRPYFMFSVEIDGRHVEEGRAVEQADIYIGNPGSAVSSGICYGVSAAGVEMRNFYFFFNAAAHRDDILGKIEANAHVPQGVFRPEAILWPEMARAQTIVVANKRFNDGLYFSRIPVAELALFLDRLAFPAPIRAYLTAQQAHFGHLLFDVGYDYLPNADGSLRYLKGSFYGLL